MRRRIRILKNLKLLWYLLRKDRLTKNKLAGEDQYTTYKFQGPNTQYKFENIFRCVKVDLSLATSLAV